MIAQRVKVSDYLEIAKKHKFFIWHFVQKNQCETCLTMFSYFEESKVGKPNDLKALIDYLQIPYFESYTYESFDFLVNNGVSHRQIWNSQQFAPLVLGFKDGVSVGSTTCYCTDGILKLVSKMDISLLENKL